MRERTGSLLGERRGIKDEHAPQMIGDGPEHSLAPLKRRPGDDRRARPQPIVGRELGQAMVVDAQEPALLEVRLGYAPGPARSSSVRYSRRSIVVRRASS